MVLPRDSTMRKTNGNKPDTLLLGKFLGIIAIGQAINQNNTNGSLYIRQTVY